ncbi:unnamed protein product [Protopolystoma xenopodis]|uniref:Uncharacterized protein n=1 Tax=Protopolystoma xenopodis TaxID=117903 RepID=A0A3S5CT54_9PLAT|nr:unnamed protein product [Protopolystoma xenopodis]
MNGLTSLALEKEIRQTHESVYAESKCLHRSRECLTDTDLVGQSRTWTRAGQVSSAHAHVQMQYSPFACVAAASSCKVVQSKLKGSRTSFC